MNGEGEGGGLERERPGREQQMRGQKLTTTTEQHTAAGSKRQSVSPTPDIAIGKRGLYGWRRGIILSTLCRFIVVIVSKPPSIEAEARWKIETTYGCGGRLRLGCIYWQLEAWNYSEWQG